jgi:hypothetical protein
MPTLLNYALGTLTTAGRSTAVQVAAGRFNWFMIGTWGGTSAQLQYSPNGSTWIDITGAVLTADGGFLDIAFSDGFVAVNLTGGAGMNLVASLNGGGV